MIKIMKRIKGKKRNKKIISKIKINRCYIYFFFFCIRKRKNLKNALLDEGMKLIMERLDLLNLFRTIYKEERINLNFEREEFIKMSDNCKKNIEDICNSLYIT